MENGKQKYAVSVRNPSQPRSAARTGPGQLLDLIRSGRARTRAELAQATGWARVTVAQRLDTLLRAGLVVRARETSSSGGRPPETFAFNRQAGVLLCADIGGSHTRVAVTDLEAGVLAEDGADLDVALGPEPVLDWVAVAFRSLLESTGHQASDVRGVGVGVPGPVEAGTGRLVSPPIMTGWDGFVVPDYFAPRYPVPIAVDRDVNIMALGEYRVGGLEGHDDLVVVKIGLGLGCAFIVQGRLYRGAQGAAGDLGHLARGGDEPCRCGNTGCLEAAAGGWAIRRELIRLGYQVGTSQDIVTLTRAGNHDAVRLVRRSGRLIGAAMADVVGLFNPSAIVVGGNLAQAHEPLLAGIREAVYRRSQPLATRDLDIMPTRIGANAGTRGAAVLVHEHLFNAERVNARLLSSA
ncbi:putative NBD/HSP70 family sugar kinase [Allonocardiopsis opalescens]|uniref:Putative NBD/HSP70 family sugar kinase n=1 Tax=Allonocardiopsis opalescens TaxID=1144618 RepID=A0A2T0Q9T0_9ACTN|nr:putative NBD/HSP70 family sugar kinase [Allonocardiopsis opalescens]